MLQAAKSGIVDEDEIARFINEYIQEQQRKNITRSGFVDDSPSDEVAVDQEGNLKYSFALGESTKTYFVAIDSRNRNVRDWKLPNRYRFEFVAIDSELTSRSQVYDLIKLTNIIEVRLLTATFSNFSLLVSPAAEDPYLFMNIDEIEGGTHPSFPFGFRVFGQLENVENRTILKPFLLLSAQLRVLGSTTSGRLSHHSVVLLLIFWILLDSHLTSVLMDLVFLARLPQDQQN